MNVNWYDVLDVEPTASADEIRTAWRAAVAELDPTDRRFRVYNQAAEVLLDPQRRTTYDTELAAEAANAEGPAADAGEPTAAPVTEQAPAPPPYAESDRPARALWVVPGWLLIGVGVVTAAALVVLGIVLSKPSAATVTTDTSTAQAAAVRAIVPLLSYDAHHLDQSAAAASPYMTPNEKEQYDKLFAVIRQNAASTGTVVQAKYLSSGIVRSGTDRVDVLVFVNQVTRNKDHPKVPVVYKNQVTVSMEKVGGSWLVDNLTTNTH